MLWTVAKTHEFADFFCAAGGFGPISEYARHKLSTFSVIKYINCETNFICIYILSHKQESEIYNAILFYLLRTG